MQGQYADADTSLMPLRYWQVTRIKLTPSDLLPFQACYRIKCPRCKNILIVGLFWPRKNTYGTAPCPFCFKTSRIPKKGDIT